MNFYNKSLTTFLPSGGFFDPEKLKSQISQLDEQVNAPDLWDNPDIARGILQKKSSLKSFFYHLPSITAGYQKKIFIFAFWKNKFDNKNKKEDIYGKERQRIGICSRHQQ